LEPNNGLSGARIALLVDFDNVVLGLEDPGFDIELVVNALRERGTIVLGRVYGDWYRHNRHRRKLMEQGLELVETPAFGPVIKNSADIRIALDGFEIGLTQSHIDTFAIVSGDSDFLPLIKKLQALGRRVLVICGNRFTSDMLRRNCNEFISYENLLAQSVGATEDATTLEGAFSLLHRAMAALRERGSEIRGSGVKQMMLQLNPVFSERTFGCTQFRQFLQKAVNAGVVKLGARDKYSGEFSVLLPDEDEAPIQQKVERRQENRGRREDKIAQIAARIEALPVFDEPSEDAQNSASDFAEQAISGRSQRELDLIGSVVENGESDYSVESFDGGAVFADDAFGYEPESMAEAQTHSPQEIAQNVIARSELLSRGLRPSKRHFSGRSGRPFLEVEDTGTGELEAEPEVELQGEDNASQLEIVPEAEVAAPAAESRRLRSRRRRRSASGQITVVSEDAAPAEATSDTAATESDATNPGESNIEGGAFTEEGFSAEGGAISKNEANDGDGANPPGEVPVFDAGEDASIGNATTLEFSHEPLGDDEAPVESAEAIEAPAGAVSEIQTALDELTAPSTEPLDELKTSPVQVLDESKGVEVEAKVPALPESNAAMETADPMGVPAVARRRRSARSKTKAKVTPLANEVNGVDAPAEVQARAPEAEFAAPLETAPEALEVAPQVEAPAQSASETQVETAPATDAPVKTRRRRPSRTPKASDSPSETGE